MGWTDNTLLEKLDVDSKQIENLMPKQCCVNCFCNCKLNINTQNDESCMEKNSKNQLKDGQDFSHLLCEHSNRCVKNCKYIKPRTCMISAGVELAPLLVRRRAKQRPISLSSTDVTKHPSEKM